VLAVLVLSYVLFLVSGPALIVVWVAVALLLVRIALDWRDVHSEPTRRHHG
jgi:hypothetical protein